MERDITTIDKTLITINSQIQIKTYNYEDVKNKLENKLLDQCVATESLLKTIKKEKD